MGRAAGDFLQEFWSNVVDVSLFCKSITGDLPLFTIPNVANLNRELTVA